MRIITAVPIIIALLSFGSNDANGQELRGAIHRVEECCTIVSIDRAINQVVVRETATGHTKTLTIANAQLLRQLQPGAKYGPGAIDGIQTPPGDVEPDWAEECCTFRTLPQGQTNIGTAVQRSTAAGPAARSMSVDIDPGVTITLQSLKRSGGRVVRLDFSVGNVSGDRVVLQNYGLFDKVHISLRNLSIVDFEGGLRYGAVVDAEGECACSRGSGIDLIEVGQELSYWVQITAPPEDVATVSIDFAGAAMIDNVRIEP